MRPQEASPHHRDPSAASVADYRRRDQQRAPSRLSSRGWAPAPRCQLVRRPAREQAASPSPGSARRVAIP
eukprot:1328705-Pyramimonas_sp.AAC.1